MQARRDLSRSRVKLKSAADIDCMRRAGRIVALTFAKLAVVVVPGITTGELDEIAEDTIRGMGAIPAFLDYNNFPATACISINEEVVHGIPGPAKLRSGDIVGIDLGAIVDGWYADSANTYAVGEINAEARSIMEVGKASLAAGIAAAQPGNKLCDISKAVQGYAEENGASVVIDLCGHGIGRNLHEEPQIPNYVIPGAPSITLLPGMTLAIEPMLNVGGAAVELLADNWTYVTKDRSLSVHYEHTIAIRENGPEILTALR